MDEEIQEAIKTAMEEKFATTQGELKALQDAGKLTGEKHEKLTNAITEQGQQLTDFLEGQKTTEKIKFNEELESWLAENIDKINDIRIAKSGTVLFTPKESIDKAPILTTSGSEGSTPDVNSHARLSNINYRNDSALLNACSRFNTNQMQVPYIEVQPLSGGYEIVAEGGLKPNMDFDWVTNYAKPVKAAAHQILSDEVVTDIPRIMSVARGNLKDRHDLFKVDRVYFGTGVGTEPTGATVSARAFAAGPSALSVAGPTAMDGINAGVTDIFTTQNFVDEAQSFPNTVLVNPWDFFIQFQSAKDGNGLPLYPQASLFNVVNIGGIIIRPWIKIPTGKVFIADMKKMNVSSYVPYSVRIGWINDQLITNQFTMVGESRFHQYIENFNVGSMIYDDMATILAAITAP